MNYSTTSKAEKKNTQMILNDPKTVSHSSFSSLL